MNASTTKGPLVLELLLDILKALLLEGDSSSTGGLQHLKLLLDSFVAEGVVLVPGLLNKNGNALHFLRRWV